MKDNLFIRGKVPMTKEEIRAIILDKLELSSTDVLVDIGAGTGSVAVEAALRLSSGKVIALEHNQEAIDLIHENINKHNVGNLTVLPLKAPDGLDDIEKTTKYFIGGSGGNLLAILEFIFSCSFSGQIIVVSAIQIETMSLASEFFRNHQYQVELVQIAVNKADLSGETSMLLANNPIFIITAKKK